jgi:hypothetical protein
MRHQARPVISVRGVQSADISIPVRGVDQYPPYLATMRMLVRLERCLFVVVMAIFSTISGVVYITEKLTEPH